MSEKKGKKRCQASKMLREKKVSGFQDVKTKQVIRIPPANRGVHRRSPVERQIGMYSFQMLRRILLLRRFGETAIIYNHRHGGPLSPGKTVIYQKRLGQGNLLLLARCRCSPQ